MVTETLTGLRTRLQTGTPGFLASVRSVSEARLLLGSAVTVIDIKEPADGALGAADAATVSGIVAMVAKQSRAPLVSATIGDLPADPARLVDAAMAQGARGVDIVKAGLIPDKHRLACIRALAPVARHYPLMAVLFADLEGDSDLTDTLQAMQAAGFLGAMIDTFDKRLGSLTDLWSLAQCERFVRQAQAAGLVCGLAGSLRRDDVASLAPLGSEVLGFRGALCEDTRTGDLSLKRVADVATCFDVCRAQRGLAA